MRILVLIHEFPPVGGGGGRVARDIATGLANFGHEIRVITSHLDGLPVTDTIDGVHIDRIPTRRKTAFRAELIEMAQYNLSTVLIGRRIIREWKPDLIHAHFAVPAGAAAFVLSKLTGVPYVLTAHLGDVPGAVPEKTDRWFKWIFPFTPPIWRNAARVIAVSEFTRKMALLHYKIPIEVIPNGVDLSALPPLDLQDPLISADSNPAITVIESGLITPQEPVRYPQSALDSNTTPAVRIVFAGRFMDQKNPADLVQALEKIKDLPWQCAMLGDGPLLESIRSRVEKNGLSDRFWLPGWVSPDDVLAEFSRSDILVLPSRSEGLSVVGVQALGMGLAMVLSDAGGNLELVRHNENGFLFPVGDVNSLTSHLEYLLKNPSMLKSARAKSREMAQDFDLPDIISRYESVFLEVIK